MTEYSKEVREEAARRANAWSLVGAWTADSVVSAPAGRALCQAVQDGALHLDPVELDKARWEVAKHRSATQGRSMIEHYRRLVISGWPPPEPVDPVEQVEELMSFDGGDLRLGPALSKLRLKIVPEVEQ